MQEAARALQNFKIKGAIKSIAPFGSGHINDTYLAETSESQYLIQRLNTHIFQSPQALENNLQLLFSTDSDILVEHLKTTEGQWLLYNEAGVWKAQVYDETTYAPEKASAANLVAEVAKGFGKFTHLGLQHSVGHFSEVIPDFHNLNWRLRQLDIAIGKDAFERVEKASELIQKVKRFRGIQKRMSVLIESGLSQRVCHNDTKIDNILLTKGTDQFRYVIDLDTVGPGYILYDFGDMMRTMLSPTKEAEPDLNKIVLSEENYRVMKAAFLEQCGTALTKIEKSSLPFGGLYMTYLMGIRFLTDYLQGDAYYKVSEPEENFIRARNQFRILELMENLED